MLFHIKKLPPLYAFRADHEGNEGWVHMIPLAPTFNMITLLTLTFKQKDYELLKWNVKEIQLMTTVLKDASTI